MDAETLRSAAVVWSLFTLPFTLLRTALLVLSLFGVAWFALARSWRREETPAAPAEPAPCPSWGRVTPTYRTWSL
jgi:hypothetical protein